MVLGFISADVTPRGSQLLHGALLSGHIRFDVNMRCLNVFVSEKKSDDFDSDA